MKIVINAWSARLGGGQTYVKNLLGNLPDNKDLEILIFAPNSLLLPNDSRIRRGDTAWSVQNPLIRAVWDITVLPKILRKEKADVLFCPGGVLSSRVPAGCRTITMFRNMTPFDTIALSRMPFGLQLIRNWILRRVMLSSMKSADLTIFISNHARRVIEQLIEVNAAVTIPHGVSSIFRASTPPPHRPIEAPDSPYLLYVSRFASYKHHFEVVEGYSRLPESLRAKHPLLLVGETDHPTHDQVIGLIKQKKLDDQVKIIGPIAYERLPSFYMNAEALIFASSCENCPNILLEGLASGRPMLCSNVMPMPEFGGTNIEYFSPYSSEEIEASLSRVLINKQHSDSVGAAALEASRNFDWSFTAKSTWNVLLAGS